MKENIKNVLWVLLIVLVVSLMVIAFKILIFRENAITNIKVNDNKITFDCKTKREDKKYSTVEGEKNRPISEVRGLKLFLNNNLIVFGDKIYEKNLRYYISIDDMVEDGIAHVEENKILSKKNNDYIDLDKKEILKGNEILELRGEVLDINNKNTYL